MNIGISTWSVASNTLEALNRISEIGFKFIELWYYEDLVSLKDEILNQLSRFDIKAISMHAPFGKQMDISALDSNIRKLGLKKLVDALKLAHEYECSILVIHPSSHFYESFDEYIKAREYFIESLTYLSKYSHEYDVKIALENMLKPESGYRVGVSVSELLEYIEQVNDDYIGICIDTGHSNYNGIRVSSEVLLAGNRLFTLHVNDNMGDKDSHLVPLEGTIDWEAFLKALVHVGYKGVFMLEVYCARNPKVVLEKSYNIAKDLVNKLSKITSKILE